MLEQALLCFNLQKLPLVSQRSIFTHKINTTSSLGYYPLSTEITFEGERSEAPQRARLSPLTGGEAGDTAGMQQAWPGWREGGKDKGREGRREV